MQQPQAQMRFLGLLAHARDLLLMQDMQTGTFKGERGLHIPSQLSGSCSGTCERDYAIVMTQRLAVSAGKESF